MYIRRLVSLALILILTAIFASTFHWASSISVVWSPSENRDPALEAGASEAGSFTILVNKRLPMSSEHAPSDLVVPDIPFTFKGNHEKRHLRLPAAAAAEELFAAAEKEGIELYGVSGYRSYKTQRWLWDYNVKKKGAAEAARYHALQGTSEHQTGLALDVTSRSAHFNLVPQFGETAEGVWLTENAHRFGFIIRYPQDKEEITGYAYEPWHIRYVGIKAAKEIYESGLTLEEWTGGSNSVSGY